MNLSCENCKAIRSFSGEPPACDECGWVYTAAIGAEKSKTNDGWKIFTGILLVLVLVTTHFGQDIYNSYKENQTATVQEVHDGAGGTFKLYMNDGTVWQAPREFSVIAGDKIRYKYEGDISKTVSATIDFCTLINVTRGSEEWAQRIESPTKDTSCPANSSYEGQGQTPTNSVAEPPETQRTLSNEEIEYYRKRNQCEFRFMDKGIYEIDGKSVGAACKQNPERRP